MEVWGWILVYAVALTLLQVLVYRYLWRREDPFAGEGYTQWHDRTRSRARGGTGPDADRETSTTPSTTPKPPRADPRPETGERPCHHCGAINETDTTFTRCWNCAERLA